MSEVSVDIKNRIVRIPILTGPAKTPAMSMNPMSLMSSFTGFLYNVSARFDSAKQWLDKQLIVWVVASLIALFAGLVLKPEYLGYWILAGWLPFAYVIIWTLRLFTLKWATRRFRHERR